MKKKLLIINMLMCIGLSMFAGTSPVDSIFSDRLIKLAGFGKDKLKKQVAQNLLNDKNNQHQLNNYIVDFTDFDRANTTSGFTDLTVQLNTGGSYTGVDVLGSGNISSLNSYLVTANSGAGPDIYIAVNLRLGVIVETKDIQPGQLSEIDQEAKSNNVGGIRRYQKYSDLQANHDQIKSYFIQNLAGDVTGEYVLFTWGKYYQVTEDPSVKTQVKLKLSAGGYYDFYYGATTTIDEFTGSKITAYVEKATTFSGLPRKTSTQLVSKYKVAIDGLKHALANKNDINHLLLDDIIKKHKLEKVGKHVMVTYIDAVKGDGALEKLTELSIYLDKVDTAIFNGYVNGVKEKVDPDNYDFFFGQAPSTASEFNKDVIAGVYEKIKKYNDEFLYIKEKANKGVITKAEFKKYFDDYLTWGGNFKKFFIPNPLFLLSANEKVNILKAIARDLNASLFDRSIQDYARDEDLVINILKTTPKEKTKVILDALKSTKLLFKMIDKFTFNDFDEIIEGLSMWIFYNYPVKEELKKLSDPNSSEIQWNELLEQKRAVYFNDDYFGRRNNEAMDADGNIHIAVRKWFDDSNEYELTVDPYKYVIVRFKNNFSMPGNSFAKGQSYLLPALTVYMLFISDTRAKWLTSGKILLDAALCLIGIGEINAAIKAGRWGRLAFATLDIGMGFGDIVINTAFRNEIQEAYPGFFEAWQKISLCYGLGRLGQVGLEAAFKKASAESLLIKESDEFTQETREFAEQINTKLKDPEIAGDLTVETQLDNLFPPGHVEIQDIPLKIQARRDHIFTVHFQSPNKFTGVHHQSALDAVGIANYEKNITRQANAFGVYEAEIKVRNSSGQLTTKTGNGGKSTFFPDAWSEAKVMEEVENAVKNNLGRYPGGSANQYFGLSKDGNIKISFYHNPDGSIGSYFPIFE